MAAGTGRFYELLKDLAAEYDRAVCENPRGEGRTVRFVDGPDDTDDGISAASRKFGWGRTNSPEPPPEDDLQRLRIAAAAEHQTKPPILDQTVICTEFALPGHCMSDDDLSGFGSERLDSAQSETTTGMFMAEASTGRPLRPRLSSHVKDIQHRNTRQAAFDDEEAWQAMPLFPDKDEMRRQVIKHAKFNMDADATDDKLKLTGWCQLLLRTQWFETLVVCVIIANALWLGYSTDANTEDLLIHAKPGFQVVENLFCIFFFVELIVRFGALSNWRYALELQTAFDTVLVILMVLETWVVSCAALMFGWHEGGDMPNVFILRLMRVVRLTRITRLVRIMQSFPELFCLVKGLAAAVRSVTSFMLFQMVVMYIFAIILRQLSDGTVMGEVYFSSVLESMLTLALSGALLDDISGVMHDVRSEDALSAIVLGIVVLLSAVTLMNMVIGVLCEVINAVAATEKEAQAVAFVKREICEALRKNDRDSDGKISHEEFRSVLKDARCVRALTRVGVDVEAMVDFSEFFFSSDECGQSFRKDLHFDDFMELVLKLRGDNTATVRDIVDLKQFVHHISIYANLHTARLEEGMRILMDDLQVAREVKRSRSNSNC